MNSHLTEEIEMKHISAIVIALSAAPALAQEPGGTFTGTLDGSPITCQFWPDQSDFTSLGATRSVNIWTSRCEGDEGQLTLGFEQVGEATASVEIRLQGAGDSGDLYGDTDTGATVAITSASEEGGLLALSGMVSARLGPSDDRGRTIDMSAPKALEGSFDGVLNALSY